MSMSCRDVVGLLPPCLGQWDSHRMFPKLKSRRYSKYLASFLSGGQYIDPTRIDLQTTNARSEKQILLSIFS